MVNLAPAKIAFVTALSALLVAPLQAEITTAHRREANEMAAEIRKAGTLFSQGKFKESGKVIKAVQARMDKMAAAGDEDVKRFLKSTYVRLGRAHALLELEGVDLPKLKDPTAAKTKPKTPPAGMGVSFVKQVAPILVAKCGRCHVQNTRGMFSMANYETLMKGPRAGKVVFEGKASGSRIIEVIEEGDMPRGGGKVAKEELEMLKKWITEGAKYDGQDVKTTLTTLVPNARPEAARRIPIVKSTGKETVSFANDIAKVLVDTCGGCHGLGRRPSARFNLMTFQGLFRGGESGPPVEPGKPEESLLLKKLKGTAGRQMPLRRPPLSDTVIAQIETWIKEGATFDGETAQTSLIRVAALARATRANHEELSDDRAKLAARNWKLGNPTDQPARVESTNFLVLGNVSESNLKDMSKEAESMAPKIAAMFKAPSGKPLIKGRMTLFVFRQRYDYSEFGQMVEKRQVPKAWRGHWKFDIVDAYGTMVPPRDDEFSASVLVAQQLAGAYVASLGKVPAWFAEGSARVVASRLDKDDARILSWDESLSDALGNMNKPDDFLTGKLNQEQTNLAAYSFVKFLMKNPARYQAVLAGLRKGKPFGESFSSGFGGSPSQAASAWARSAARATPRRRRKK